MSSFVIALLNRLRVAFIMIAIMLMTRRFRCIYFDNVSTSMGSHSPGQDFQSNQCVYKNVLGDIGIGWHENATPPKRDSQKCFIYRLILVPMFMS